jgi:hypothetical protein
VIRRLEGRRRHDLSSGGDALGTVVSGVSGGDARHHGAASRSGGGGGGRHGSILTPSRDSTVGTICDEQHLKELRQCVEKVPIPPIRKITIVGITKVNNMAQADIYYT